MASPAPGVIGHEPSFAAHPHPLQIRGDLHDPTDRGGVDRVVVGVQAHVVIAGQTDPVGPAGLRSDRRQGKHRRAVRLDPLGGSASDPPVHAAVGAAEPGAQLRVEVLGVTEASTGQERGLEVAVGPLHQALGLRVAWFAEHDLDPERPAEGLGGGRELDSVVPASGRRPLPVPDQRPRHRTEGSDQLPLAGEQVPYRPRGDHPADDPPRVARDHRDHRHLAPAVLAGPERDVDVGEPQVALGELARLVGGPGGRVRREVDGTQLADAVLQHRHRVGPADPLGDHRRRHVRPLPEQLVQSWLHRIDDRAPGRPLVAGRPSGGDRRLDRVLRDPEQPGDRLDRHRLRSVQPSDLRPVLHPQHPLPPRLGWSQGYRRGSVFKRR